MNDTYRAPSGATATAGSQAPREPGIRTGVLHVFPASADRAKAMSDGPFGSQIQAAYTSWRQVASSTSALPAPQTARLTSVTGPTATAGRDVAAARGPGRGLDRDPGLARPARRAGHHDADRGGDRDVPDPHDRPPIVGALSPLRVSHVRRRGQMSSSSARADRRPTGPGVRLSGERMPRPFRIIE